MRGAGEGQLHGEHNRARQFGAGVAGGGGAFICGLRGEDSIGEERAFRSRAQTFHPKKEYIGSGCRSGCRSKPKTKINSEFNSIHCGIEINKC